MKVEIGKKYEICTTYIAGHVDSCFTVDVKSEKERDYVQAYVDDPSDRVKVKQIKEN